MHPSRGEDPDHSLAVIPNTENPNSNIQMVEAVEAMVEAVNLSTNINAESPHADTKVEEVQKKAMDLAYSINTESPHSGTHVEEVQKKAKDLAYSINGGTDNPVRETSKGHREDQATTGRCPTDE